MVIQGESMKKKIESRLVKLAELFDVSVEELMKVKRNEEKLVHQIVEEIVPLILKGVALAMGVSVIVLSMMNTIEIKEAIKMLGISITCIALAQFMNIN